MKSEKKPRGKSSTPKKTEPAKRAKARAEEKLSAQRPAKAVPKKTSKSTTKASSVSPAKAKASGSSTPSKRALKAGATAVASPPSPKKKLNIPAILLEGDSPISLQPKPSGPGVRYALAPEAPAPHVPVTAPELPESYGTGRLFLSARDPHWLYAAWDLPVQKQRDLNSKSRDGHLALRVFADDESSPATPDIHVHPESRTWFIYVPRAETRYRAELGYYDSKGEWQSVSSSRSTFTPPEAPSEEITAEFATIPVKVTFQQLIAMVREFASENRPLIEAVLKANETDLGGEVPARVEPAEPWSPQRMAEITALFTIDRQRRVWIGSLEITELIRRRLEEENASMAAAELARGQTGGVSSEEHISSPYGGELPRKFWFNINAELVIYGATEPDATVAVGDRQIKLRPDGSFSFRFALPDGRYELPVSATSPDKIESREARLKFSRSTDYRGDVPPHPQDKGLRKPSAKNVQ